MSNLISTHNERFYVKLFKVAAQAPHYLPLAMIVIWFVAVPKRSLASHCHVPTSDGSNDLKSKLGPDTDDLQLSLVSFVHVTEGGGLPVATQLILTLSPRWYVVVFGIMSTLGDSETFHVSRLMIESTIILTSPCNVDPLTPHFYIVRLGFTGENSFFVCLL